MKKVIVAAAIGAVALASAGVASAAWISDVSDTSSAYIGYYSKFKSDIDVKQKAYIGNAAATASNSGGNHITSADDQKGTTLYTGPSTALTEVENEANDSSVTVKSKGSCGCADDITGIKDESSADIKHEEKVKNETEVKQKVESETLAAAASDTGSNYVTSGDSLKGTSVTTGESGAGTSIKNKFNTSWVKLKKSSF